MDVRIALQSSPLTGRLTVLVLPLLRNPEQRVCIMLIALLLSACIPVPEQSWVGVPRPPGSPEGTVCWSWANTTPVCQWGAPVPPPPPAPSPASTTAPEAVTVEPAK